MHNDGTASRAAAYARVMEATKAGDDEALREALEAAAKLPDPHPHIFMRMAALHLRKGQPANALHAADRALELDPDLVPARRTAAWAARTLGQGQRALDEFDRLERIDSDRGHRVHALHVLVMMGQTDEATRRLIEGVENGLDDVLLLSQARLLPPNARLAERAIEVAKATSASAPTVERQAALDILTAYGVNVPAHLHALSRANAGHANGGIPTPGDAALRRPVVEIDRDTSVQSAIMPAASGTVVLFTGLLAAPIRDIDRYMAALGVSALHLRDASRFLFLNGVAELGPDYETTLARLRKFVMRAGSGPLTTIGASSGGFAAMRYGIDLGADATVCFSPPSDITERFLADDGRGRIVARRLQSLDESQKRLAPLLTARENRHPIHVVYGTEMQQDRRHADELRGLPGVSMHPLEGSDEHNTLAAMAHDGTLLPFLERTVARRAQDERIAA